MDISRNGVIIFTTQFYPLISFYQMVFNSKELFGNSKQNERICCLQIDDFYIMIEEKFNDDFVELKKNERVKLRFNVRNLEGIKHQFDKLNLSYEYKSYEWGAKLDIKDPDGNVIGFRDHLSFEKQIQKKY